jgi:hypothetical protein
MKKRAPAAVILALAGIGILIGLGLHVHTSILLKRARERKNRNAILRFRMERGGEEAAIRRRLSEIRELGFKRHVPSRVMRRDEIESFVLRKMHETYSDDEIEGYELALKLFGVIPQDRRIGDILASLYASQAGGFYDYHTKTLYRVAGSPLKTVILAHEYTHALQDQHFGMSNLPLEIKDNDDRALAAMCIVEGDAMLASTDYLLKNPDLETFLGTAAAASDASGMDAMKKAPSFIREIAMFPYMKGTIFVEVLRKRGGWDAVNDLFRDPPVSSEQVLHPEKYLGPDRDEPQPAELKVDLAGLRKACPGEWRLARANVMGEFAVYALLNSRVLQRHARIASEGWGGDRYEIYRCGTRAVLSWSTRWDSRGDANEFFDRMSAALRKRLGAGAARSTPDATAWVCDGMSAAIELDKDKVHVVKATDGATMRALLSLFGLPAMRGSNAD